MNYPYFLDKYVKLCYDISNNDEKENDMEKILDKINLPKDLKELNIEEKEILAEELRQELIYSVSL